MRMTTIKPKKAPTAYVRDLAKFVMRHNTGWHSYTQDKLTRETIEAGVIIGFAEVNDYGQVKLRSESRAKQYLGVATSA